MPAAGGVQYIEAVPDKKQFARTQGVLVLLHAFPLNEHLWEPQMALSERGWRVIAPRLRGRSMDDFAAVVVDLLDALHIEEAVVGGLSMGGYATFALFRLAPRYFRGMVLADTRPQADTPEGVEARRRMLALVRDKGPDAVADEMIPKLVGETTRSSRPEIVARVRELIRESSADTIADAITALMTRPDSSPLLAAIHCPTLVVVGEEDAITPPALSQQMHAAIGGSQYAAIPGAGHLSSLERPQAFNDVLADFLEHRL
jgi:3-oxoadipate enol-lactonase